MRTLLTFLLLLPLSALCQNWPNEKYRAMRPEEVDPYETYIFQYATGGYKTPDGKDACVGLFIVSSSGEWVRLATSIELCSHPFPQGTYMNFKPNVARNDSIQ